MLSVLAEQEKLRIFCLNLGVYIMIWTLQRDVTARPEPVNAV